MRFPSGMGGPRELAWGGMGIGTDFIFLGDEYRRLRESVSTKSDSVITSAEVLLLELLCLDFRLSLECLKRKGKYVIFCLYRKACE